MPTRAELKANAKQALTGKWGKGALIVLCYAIASIVLGLLNIIPFIGGIAVFVIQVPMMLGLMFSFIKLRRGEEVGAFDFVTIGFQNFKRAWCIFGSILLKMLPPIIAMVVVFIIGIVGGVSTIVAGSSLLSATGNHNSSIKMTSDYSYESVSYTTNPYARGSSYSSSYDYEDDDYGISPYSSSYSSPYSSSYRTPSVQPDLDDIAPIKGLGAMVGSLAIFGIMFIGIFIVSIWSTIRGLLYAQSYFIAYDNPNMTAKEAVQTSENLMKGNRGKLFVLQLSFIGWAMLASITFGIGYFWLIPYMMVTFVCFYEALTSGNNGNNMNGMNNMNNMNYAGNNGNNMNNMNNMNYAVNNGNNMNYNNANIMNNNNMSQAPEVTEYVPVNFEQNTNSYNQAPVQNTNQYNPVTPEPTTNQYNPVTPEPTANQYNPVTPEPTVNQYNPVTPEPTTNQYNPVTPEPTVNQYNPVTPEPTTNQYNPVTPDTTTNQFNYNPTTPENNINQFNPINNDFNNPNNNM